jgi:outer membrane protein assembly factor BamB
MQAYYLAPREQDIAVVATSSSDFLRGAGSLLALDEAGLVIWQATASEDRFSAPLVMDRKVYVLAGSNILLIVSPEQEGDYETRIPLDISVAAAAPAIVDGVAYIPCRRPEMLALELTGKVLWHFSYETKSRDWLDTTPAISGPRLFAASSAGSLFALDRDSGEMIWQISAGDGRGLSPPVADGDRLYVGRKEGLLALEASSGRSLWTFDTVRPIRAAPLIINDTLYVTCYDHNLYALDKMTGEVHWHHTMTRRIEAPPLLASSALLVVDRGGQIAALERPPEPEAVEEPERDLEALRAEAEEYERQGKPLLAAELWCQMGELDRAAEMFELGADWLNAAETWEKLFRYNRRAGAYEQHALAIAAQDLSEEQKAEAWELAADAYRETTLREERVRAQTEVARYRKQPILEIEVTYDDLEEDTWSTVNYTVVNKGFGPARLMQVFIERDRFETEHSITAARPVLHPDSPPYTTRTQVRPLEKGEGVPMKVVVDYRDVRNQDHRFDRTFNVLVGSQGEERDDISTGSFDDMSSLSTEERMRSVKMARELNKHFSSEELNELLFALGLDPENLPGDTKAAKIRQMIKYYRRRDSLSELIETGRDLRADVDWDQFE